MHFRGQGLAAESLSRAESHQPSAAGSGAETPPQSRKSKLSGASLGGQTASTGRFGGRTWLRQPNLSSSRMGELKPLMHILPPKPSKLKPNHAKTCINTFLSI
ncbi:hypothetical protein MANES_01G043951v8 [Manihot esculenta]|uniref:Uncharacterized protein n=1 Tax=Manihot esculenta TaxID=3983 RepID=A0ACB7IFI5_MANES|nr:hypothetical protein MANES_01G043951v8 [Manihot esculenta]